jgi:hypothetical protein
VTLAIEVDDVVEVLLADGWHRVADKSFELDSYEYIHGTDSRGEFVMRHGGGQSGISATGFVFKEEGQDALIYGPLTAILAVRTRSSDSS